MYQTVKSLTQKFKKFQTQLHCIESKSGEMVTEPMQIAARWKQYCQELSEDNNDSVNLPQSVHMQPEPSPLRPEVAWAIDAVSNKW